MPSQLDLTVNLSDQDIADINAALDVIRAKLPQRRAVAADESKRLYKLGDNSVGFVELAQKTSGEHSTEMADAVRPPAFDAARASYDAVSKVAIPLAELANEVDGLQMLLGAQPISKGLSVYESTKRAAKGNPALQPLADQLGERFKKTKAAKAGQPGTGTKTTP